MTQSDQRSRARDEIYDNLKRAYDEVSHQKVPDRFTDLLAQLREAEQAQKKGASDEQ